MHNNLLLHYWLNNKWPSKPRARIVRSSIS